jgi:hypothetical protein
VKEETGLRVQVAVVELGYVRNGTTGQLAEHWRRSGFASWLFSLPSPVPTRSAPRRERTLWPSPGRAYQHAAGEPRSAG